MIPLSRTAADNIMLNRHDIRNYIQQGKLIKGLPLVDSTNPRHIKDILGNELKVLKHYAPCFDFIANLISVAHRKGTPGNHIKDVDENYYKINISENTWKKYFSHCGDHNIRYNLARQIMKDLQTGYVLLPIYDKIHGHGMEKRAPFRIMAEKYYSDGTKYRELYFSKAVFKSLVTGECFENGGDGYIEIPSNFYPLLTAGDKGELQSYNPIYKINIHGLMKNTHKKGSVEIPRKELIQSIAPEYIDDDGDLKSITAASLHDSLIKNTREVLSSIPYSLLVKNFYFGKQGGMSTLYFRTPTEPEF